MTTNTCATCAHWNKPPDGDTYSTYAGVVFGTCERIRHRETIEEEATANLEGWDARTRAESTVLAESKAHVTDASGYAAWLRTCGDFGCSLYEARP